MFNKQKSEGISIYLAMVVMSILLAVAFGINSILFSQIKTIKGMENSVVAFFASETGIEKALKEATDDTYSASGYLDLDEDGFQGDKDSTYDVSAFAAGVDGCPVSANFCIKSIGTYQETKRAIQIQR